MAIFSRRNLQRMIDENDLFLLRRQTKKHVDELNKMATTLPLSLAFEWEVVLLNAVSKFGKVFHEKKFNGKTPDIYFEFSDETKDKFIGEIATVSDRGIDKLYPYEALRDELNKRLKKNGINPAHVSLVGGYGSKMHYRGGPKVEQKLPGRARFAEIIFGEPFNHFVREIIREPTSRQVYPVSHNNVLAVIITYDPRQEGMWGGYEIYTSAFHITENAVYQKLEQKVPQLTQTAFKGPLGIFLCDGDCGLFRRNSDGRSYSVDEIINYFLNGHQEISFVVTFTTTQERPYKVTAKLYEGVSFDKVRMNLMQILKRMNDVFPEAECNVMNAINYLKGQNPNAGRSYWGGLEESETPGGGTRIKISARAILELLSGTVDQNDFFKRHNFIPSGKSLIPTHNPFKQSILAGELISNISTEKSSSDDDWLTFELKGPDVAISPFRTPEK